jgi:2-methylisocitrate lyase-like PEP mutase family enzyme
VTQEEKGAAFRALHGDEPFVIPNPWDAGSAKVLGSLGFRALATTSGGFAFTVGKLDGGVTLDQVIDHTRVIAAATELPVSVDLENGHGHSPEDVARAITGAAEAGAVGGSIEDWDRDGAIYELNHSAERIAAAREAADSLGFPFTLTARAENFLHDNPDLDDTIVRLQAYERAGADVLYAPGLGTTEQIRAISEATGKPLNVLARSGLSMSEMADAGAQRVSVGSRLLWVAVAAMVSAAGAIRDSGDFSQLAVRVQPDQWLG